MELCGGLSASAGRHRRSACPVGVLLDVVPPGTVVAVLLKRTVRGQNQMLVQWACTWEPFGQVDPGAVEDYDGDVIVESAEESAVVSQVLGTCVAASATAQRRRKVRRRNW